MATVDSITSDGTSIPAALTASTGVSAASGKIQFVAPGGYTARTLTSALGYDLTSNALTVDLTDPPALAGAGQEHWYAHRLGIDANNFLQFYLYCDDTNRTVEVNYCVAGGFTALGIFTFDPATHLSFQIRSTGGNIEWRTWNGTSWATQGTAANPFAITALKYMLEVDGSDAFTVKIDNLNIPPGSGGGGPTAAASFAEAFDSKDTTRFTWYGAAGVSSGNLLVGATGYGNSDQGIIATTAGQVNMSADGAFIAFDLNALADATASGEAWLELELTTGTTIPFTDFLQFFVYQTDATAATVEANYRTASGTISKAFNKTRQRFLRFLHSGANILWQTSPDYSTWTTVRTVATTSLPTLTAMHPVILGKGVATGSWSIGSINVAPSAVVTAPTAPTSPVATAVVNGANLTWAAPASNGGSAITAYEVTRTGDTATQTLAPTVLAYSYASLTPGVAYTFTIKARNAAGLGAAATVTATPTAPTPTDVPGVPTAVSGVAGNGSAVVSWTAPGVANGTITGYDVLDQNGVVRGSVVGTAVTTTVSGLTNGMQYQFRVVAKNANGSSLPSAASATVTPVASGSTSSALSTRSSFGAYAGTAAAQDNLELAIGQALQPLVIYYTLGTTLDAAAITAAAARGRRVLLMLSTAGFTADQLAAGGYDATLRALATKLEQTAVTVFIAPMYEANDWRRPWSPAYSTLSPGYSAAADTVTDTVADYLLAFDRISRVLRENTSRARIVWSVNVDPQPNVADQSWELYWPGALADVMMLSGFNYGIGPGQGVATATTWRTAATIFDTAYATAAGLHATKPIWFYTASHEPSAIYAPVGGGFPPGAQVGVDSAHSKATWVTDLLADTDWPRVTAVVWHSVDDTRNWSLTSTPAVGAAVRSTVPNAAGWTLTQVAQDQLGDFVRDYVNSYAAWAAGGAQPTVQDNLYARPDALRGVRAALRFTVPSDAGVKQQVTISTAEELAWNRIHGELLRQLARNGMQGWAFASGARAATDPAWMFSGSSSSSQTVLDNARDALPGPLMQAAAGMKAPDGGAATSNKPGAPATLTITAKTTGGMTANWTAPASDGGSALTGYYVYVYEPGATPAPPGPGVFNPEYVSDLQTAATLSMVLSNMKPDTSYRIGVAAINANGTGVRVETTTKTAATPVTPPTTGRLPAKVCAVYWETYANGYNPVRITTLNNNYNVINIFQLAPVGNAPGSTGAMYLDATQATIDQLKVDIPVVRAAGKKVMLVVGGANAQVRLDTTARVTAFVNSIKSIYTTLGGFDGLDLNNFEGATDLYTANWISACSQLRAAYGANFAFTSPPSCSHYLNQLDRDIPHLKALSDADLMDFVAPQYYDGSGNNLLHQIRDVTTPFMVAAGIPMSKIGIGFGIKASSLYWTTTDALAAWNAMEAANPTIKGAFNFSKEGDPSDTFASAVGPAILT